jgi:glutamine kinase
MKFSSKAETLGLLSDFLTSATILPQIRFTVLDWENDSGGILKKIEQKNWINKSLIVRSSTAAEDKECQSLAGHFLSVQGVCGKGELIKAIGQVINSYSSKNKCEDQVFIQPQLDKIIMSGVVFSCDPSNNSPYIVINYTNSNKSTESVTSGKSNELNTYYYYKHKGKPPKNRLGRITSMVLELESIFKTNAIDAEFAVSEEDELFLLQVRPLFSSGSPGISSEKHKSVLADIHQKIVNGMRPHPYLFGKKTLYGVMPDWNPAEIIGLRPRPLSLALYKELITDNIWAYQRSNYGYRNLRSFPLLISFAGLPYIDVRVSFNSFVPADIPNDIAQHLIDYYINRLSEIPSFHDKVEFEIVFSCYTLDLLKRMEQLQEYGISKDDCLIISDSLRSLTNNIIHLEKGLWQKDISRIDILKSRIKTIHESELEEIDKIYWLIEDCKRYGTLPFAGLARAAFIAVQLLQSMVATGIINNDEYTIFLNSLNTISSTMTRESCQLSRKNFFKKYGHLRPGTYDILSPRYDEAPDKYFDFDKKFSGSWERKNFNLSLVQLRKLENLLKVNRLDSDVLGIFDYIKKAIEGREYAKFIFTKSISEILKQFKALGRKSGFSVDDCSYCDIACIFELYGSSLKTSNVIREKIEKGKKEYSITQQISLPPLITTPDNVYNFSLPQSRPNFITMLKVSGPVIRVDEQKEQFKNSILFLHSADPGYDWIFSHDIGGFITAYGGANSHMAIRAHEFGVPAVIGAGESLYNKWISGKFLEIDCANEIVRIIN